MALDLTYFAHSLSSGHEESPCPSAAPWQNLPLASLPSQPAGNTRLTLLDGSIYKGPRFNLTRNPYHHDLGPSSLQYGLLDGSLHTISNDALTTSFNDGSTWPIADPSEYQGVNNSCARVPDFGFTDLSNSFDSSLLAIPHPECQTSGFVAWDIAQEPQAFPSGLPHRDKATLSSQSPGGILLDHDDDFNLFAPGASVEPSGSPTQALQDFDFSIIGGFGDVGYASPSSCHSSTTTTTEVSMSKQYEGMRNLTSVSSQASYTPSPPTASSKMRRDDSDSERSSTPGDCPFCDNFSGDAKRLRFVHSQYRKSTHANSSITGSISDVTSRSIPVKSLDVFGASALQGISRGTISLPIGRKLSGATSVQLVFEAGA
ncbi:hypothetical protein BDP81DRAFT_446961 [Colletotrichum phormii]|uniref:Uncharacterized protein n=1 Tax=Colletotrichum phormii TaxID=359342 RepID=A0AAI9ZZH1_9PEZI|nr:uncharacterized protein BDP81DRAFT_446961 [Colletotrichum phormii]KAK1640716.1 hypothetical protein BDP81DRAFT_446961 [Colletotrichum phormii]